MVLAEEVAASQLHLGETIRAAVTSVNAWQHGGNTLLGSILLLSPIAAAAGMTPIENNLYPPSELRKNIKAVAEATTPSDAVAVYEAIRIARPSGLAGKAPALDVNDPSSLRRILEDRVTLYEVFKISAPYDAVAREWVENYPLTFEIGLPYFRQQLAEGNNLTTAIVHTFLQILATVPDTLIVRKAGLEKAKDVSTKAERILNLGGLATSRGREQLALFDSELRRVTNQQNPGTTADIIAAIIAVNILNGYRP